MNYTTCASLKDVHVNSTKSHYQNLALYIQHENDVGSMWSLFLLKLVFIELSIEFLIPKTKQTMNGLKFKAMKYNLDDASKEIKMGLFKRWFNYK